MNKNISKNILDGLLKFGNPKFPLPNNHYITGKNIWLFSNIASVENTLTCFTSNISCKFNCLKNKYRQ